MDVVFGFLWSYTVTCIGSSLQTAIGSSSDLCRSATSVAYALKPLVVRKHCKVNESMEKSLFNQCSQEETSLEALSVEALLPCNLKMVNSLSNTCLFLSS